MVIGGSPYADKSGRRPNSVPSYARGAPAVKADDTDAGETGAGAAGGGAAKVAAASADAGWRGARLRGRCGSGDSGDSFVAMPTVPHPAGGGCPGAAAVTFAPTTLAERVAEKLHRYNSYPPTAS